MLRFGLLVLVVACYLVSTSSSERLKCGYAMNPFDLSKFEGDWYVISTTPTVYGCVMECDKYTYAKEGQFVKTEYTAFRLSNGEKVEEHWLVTPDSKLPAKLFSKGEDGLFNFTTNILDTDYKNHAITQTCITVNEKPIFEYFHVLSRVMDPDEKIVDNAIGFLKSKGYTTEEFTDVPQDCYDK